MVACGTHHGSVDPADTPLASSRPVHGLRGCRFVARPRRVSVGSGGVGDRPGGTRRRGACGAGPARSPRGAGPMATAWCAVRRTCGSGAARSWFLPLPDAGIRAGRAVRRLPPGTVLRATLPGGEPATDYAIRREGRGSRRRRGRGGAATDGGSSGRAVDRPSRHGGAGPGSRGHGARKPGVGAPQAHSPIRRRPVAPPGGGAGARGPLPRRPHRSASGGRPELRQGRRGTRPSHARLYPRRGNARRTVPSPSRHADLMRWLPPPLEPDGVRYAMTVL